MFKSLSSLVLLSLGDNQISEIEVNSFEKCLNLQKIYLYNNKLIKIHSNVFRSLPSLSYLYLNDNKTKEIEAHAFGNCPKLQTVNLNNNKLSKLELGVFKSLIKKVNLFTLGFPL
jgi:Leucine-rich repeat (LRR) protein